MGDKDGLGRVYQIRQGERVQTSRNRCQTAQIFRQFDRGSESKRRVPNLNEQPLPARDPGAQAGELATQLLLGGAARGLL